MSIFEERNAPSHSPYTSEIDRRNSERYCGRAQARLYRQSDQLREGVDGQLHDISMMGMGILIEQEEFVPEPGEQVKVRLRNLVQRVDREVRGVVRHITEVVGGWHLVGIELTMRLTPLEVSLLKMTSEADEGEGKWV